MGKPKFSKSIFFIDNNGESRFLFRCINYGGENDELKFIFDHPESSSAILHIENDQKYPDDIDITFYGELSYHSDGSLLWKLPNYPKIRSTKYDNPHGPGARRTPLCAIDEWEPVVIGNIIRYNNCKAILLDDSIIIPENQNIFSGQPFEYYIFLGHLKYQTPPNNKSNEMIVRIEDVAQNLDLLIWFRKSDYKGFQFNIGNTTAVNDNNRVRIAEPRLQIDRTGAIELDLVILWNAEWNTGVVDDSMQLNIVNLFSLPPMTKIAKVYLKSNPYLNQLIELVGFNKVFAIQPFFRKQILKISLVGILDRDDGGKFLGIGTGPQSFD